MFRSVFTWRMLAEEIELRLNNLSETGAKGMERKSHNQDTFWKSIDMIW